MNSMRSLTQKNSPNLLKEMPNDISNRAIECKPNGNENEKDESEKGEKSGHNPRARFFDPDFVNLHDSPNLLEEMKSDIPHATHDGNPRKDGGENGDSEEQFKQGETPDHSLHGRQGPLQRLFLPFHVPTHGFRTGSLGRLLPLRDSLTIALAHFQFPFSM